ncbi:MULTISPECIES: LacI family DNA-binding transcriptional regulator [Thermoanaerobacter]|uniref:Transcriptional regulator, LacI family n=1 Tax=Thermoanaerobacter wiegelii Rt8.B1 TaxID=697303 RepID=G2MUQ7_9THEO|nr:MULTISPECIES: LacI family DNA-binding transcriptional regulator [Thermoanaerobacter]AEM77580.1 transcriptional regulator, LacI family [Thermoanaerobacter wiegelii Rt8.B1]EGD52014.1 transcriptional regulator, LacI family [Thermoanaerobacter ethanolicus JW 200]UZQ83075.1 LacI family DNA-binding transcriptional regulator [Thermoanaerobacter sp. RKWS2]
MTAIKRKKVTMKDIAERLNLSINAVSLALNDKVGVSEETRKIVLKTADEMGYFDENPSFIAKNHFRNICLLIEERNFRDTHFYTKVILGIENEAKKNNYDILVNFMNQDDFQVPSSVETRKVSGILVVGTIKDEHLEKLLKYDIPTVLVDHASFTISTDAVLTQNMPGSYMATQYLIRKGHTQIGFFGEIDFSLSFKERWLGFNEAMRNAGLNVDPIFNVNPGYCVIGQVEQYVLSKNYKEVANIISKLDKLPTAWVCSNDSAAITLYNALSILGIKVPDDISVVGFDDIDICNIVTPHLTTIRINKELMGAKAVKRLLWRMENPKEPCDHIRMEVKLIERESVREVRN